jgi:hypothetical protein
VRQPIAINNAALGDSFRATWERFSSNICDEDPMEGRTLRVIIVGQCKDDDKTANASFAIYITPYVKDDFSQPIVAMGFLGSDPKLTANNLPPLFGKPVDVAVSTLGNKTSTMALRTLTVDMFANNTYVLSDNQTIIGIVVGNMPIDPTAERWGVFDQIYRRYSQRR